MKGARALSSEFLYGAGYYPLMHDEVDWERDIRLMKDSGINLIRTAELFNTWDRIEPSKGHFNFDFLDKFFDLCEQYGMKILLGTGTASPPYWLHEMYPDVNILNNHGEQYPNNVSYTWACIDNPGYLKETERYLRTLVERYKYHKALYAYQIHNEVSFPFMPLKSGDIDMYCYCDHSKNHFREWVKDKYKTLDQLNHVYRWGATNTCHTSWEQVEPPKTKPSSWSSVTRWLDWRLFWMDNFVKFIGWQHEIIKELDREHITSTNIFFLKSQDPLGVLTALDQFEMAKVVDMIGYDLYPGSGDKLEKKPEFASMFLDMSRSTAKPLGKNYWLMETDSGPINGWVLGPSRNVKGFDLIRNVFEAVGHDAKLTLYQGWREWDFQPLHWGAIVDLDGKPTERTEAVKTIGDVMKVHGKSLVAANNPKGEVAILISKENAIVLNGMGQDDFLMKAMRGAYTFFWKKGYQVDFVTPEQVANGYVNDYKVMYMPFMAVINEELAEGLDAYVRQGGNLIGTARCGMLGEYGWYNHQIPCFKLGETFGISAFDAYSNTHPQITYRMKPYKGYWHKEEVKVISDNVKVIARYNDDSPAVTIHTHGEGSAIYFGTHPDVAYLEENSYLLWDILDDVFEKADIRPMIQLNYTNEKYNEIDAHYLQGEGADYMIVTNYANKNHGGFFNGQEKCVRITINAHKIYEVCLDIMTGKELALKQDGNVVLIETTVIRNKVQLLQLT